MCLVLFCYVVLSALSSFAVISQGIREFVALLQLSSCCYVADSFLCRFPVAGVVG